MTSPPSSPNRALVCLPTYDERDNPRAMFRDPITMDDYFSSRMVADPLLLFDCDYPVNASCAAILTTVERARDLARPVVTVDALAYGTGRRPDWLFAEDFVFGGTVPCGQALWKRSSFTPSDVDVAELYDGFTHITISWVEALGLCGIGEFHDCLRQLYADGTITLPAWTGPLYALPEPQYALLIGHGIAYYASLRG